MEKLKENTRLEKEDPKILIEKEKGEVRFKIVENMKCFKENSHTLLNKKPLLMTGFFWLLLSLQTLLLPINMFT